MGNLPTAPPNSYRSRFDWGVDGIEVRLLDPPDAQMAAEQVAVFAETTFGDIKHPYDYRGTEDGDDEAWLVAQNAAEFKHVIPNALETVALTFTINGVSRATTHQLVRTRVGAGFGQFSQRANNLFGFNMRLPDSFKVVDSKAVEHYKESIAHLQRFYKAAIDAGVPYQDARYVVPEGTQTSITATYNLLALIGTVRRRICNRMQWEVNYVARRMADLTVAALPWVGRALRSGCEARGTCQTIDPMFEPSCLWFDGESADWCADSPALIELMDGADYNWQRWTNGSLKFYNTDMARLTKEGAHPNTTWTLSYRDTTQPLSYRTQEGLWKKATK